MAFLLRPAVMSMAILLWASVAAHAQQFSMQADADAPLDVRAEALDVIEQDGRALFSGEVVLSQGDIRLTSDRLRLDWSEGYQLRSGRAEGRVYLRSSQQQEIRGQWAAYDFATSTLVIGDEVTVVMPPQGDQDGATLSGKRFTIDMRAGLGTLSGGPQGRVKGVLQPKLVK